MSERQPQRERRKDRTERYTMHTYTYNRETEKWPRGRGRGWKHVGEGTSQRETEVERRQKGS